MHPQLLRLLYTELEYKQNTELIRPTQPSPTGESIQMFLVMPPSHSDAFINWTGGGHKGVCERKSPDGKQRHCYRCGMKPQKLSDFAI